MYLVATKFETLETLSQIAHWLSFGTGALITFVLLFSGVVFYREKEKTAFFRAILLALVLSTPFAVGFIFGFKFLELFLAGASIVLVILFLIPVSTPASITDLIPGGRYDERDIMFSRKELVPGTDKFEQYYARRPENKEKDDAFRAEAGLLSPQAKYFLPNAFGATETTFKTVELLHKYVDGSIAHKKAKMEPKDITAFLKGWARKMGVADIGVTEVKPYHFYSVKGRRDEYNNPIEIRHKYAIAITVEMVHEMVKPAPQASIIMESARQYLESGKIAVQLAGFLRELGYSAKAHIDGNYQVVCPLVARDAGLGEIGRMGLLMTPKLGPRVRIAVVTTELELVTHKYRQKNSVLDFCVMCKKCADCCPSQSIEFDKPSIKDGVKRWKIDSESCFTYWCKSGTDCGRCMAVCPYSHPDNALHNFIRWGVSKSRLFRIAAVWLDDYFYGKKPKPHPLPKWL